MAAIITRTGKGAAITQSENDSNLDSLCGINEPQTGTTYTVDAADQNSTIEFSNAASITATLTLISIILAANDTSDFQVSLKNIGVGIVTVTPTTDAFDDGTATKTLAQYEWMTIQTDSTQSLWNIIASSNASKIDGLDASQLLRSDADDTTTGNLTINKTGAEFTLDSSSQNATIVYNDGGTLRTTAQWNRTSDAYNIIQYDTDGSTLRAQLALTELGKVNVATGTLQLAGVDVTASATKLNYNDITTLGTVQANKTVTADSNLDVTGINDLTVDNSLVVNGVDMAQNNFFQASSTISGTSIPVNAVMPFDVEDTDLFNEYNNTTYQYTPQTAGWYEIIGSLTATATGHSTGGIDQAVEVWVRKNGTKEETSKSMSTPTFVNESDFFTGTARIIILLNGSTDYVDIFADMNVTGPSLGGGSLLRTFSGKLIYRT